MPLKQTKASGFPCRRRRAMESSPGSSCCHYGQKQDSIAMGCRRAAAPELLARCARARAGWGRNHFNTCAASALLPRLVVRLARRRAARGPRSRYNRWRCGDARKRCVRGAGRSSPVLANPATPHGRCACIISCTLRSEKLLNTHTHTHTNRARASSITATRRPTAAPS